MRLMVRELAKAVDERLAPILRAEYTADSSLLERIAAFFTWARVLFFSEPMEKQRRRLAASTLSMAEAGTTAAFVQSVNRAVGIDMNRLMSQEGLSEYMQVAAADNVALIKSVGSTYLDSVEQAVMGGIRSGESNTTIAKRVQAATGVTYKRARLIARDQVAKANSDIARFRHEQSGIKRFRWATAKDVRVSGNPAGRYPGAKIKCYMIARQDIGYGPGVYLIDKGAEYAGELGLFPGKAHVNCRCTYIPQIEGFDY